MANSITISGMIGGKSTFFAKSPVVVTLNNLQFPEASPIKVVRLDVIYNGIVVGSFPGEVVGTESISFDISSALNAIWSDDDLSSVTRTVAALVSGSQPAITRTARAYSLKAYREYIDSTDDELTTDESRTYPGGKCLPGGLTEWERFVAESPDVSALQNSNLRFGDASTKPISSPERVGRDSITSWVDIAASGIKSYFYAPDNNSDSSDSSSSSQESSSSESSSSDNYDSAHAPQVLRDDGAEYVDFLFLNRRGAVESCAARMLESMDINVKTTQYARVERPAFRPSRSLMAVASGGRRSWAMSSGHQTREWAEWWTLEFLMARRHWMRYKGRFVPVTVTPAKAQVSIYDRTKQQMPHVDFTVSLALEG